MRKIGLGGGCHWCTEAVFQSLKGVLKVEQGFIAPADADQSFSEAVIVHFDEHIIDLRNLVEIHLLTHKSTSAHSMRNKYRSAIYVLDQVDYKEVGTMLSDLQPQFQGKLITKVHHFGSFKPSREEFHDYFYSNPKKPFCETYISPKIRVLMQEFSQFVDRQKLK